VVAAPVSSTGDAPINGCTGRQPDNTAHMPRTPANEAPKVITAKWTTAIDGDPQQFGTVVLDDEFEIRFPMLASFTEIPIGTTVLWGIGEHLKRCTAVTLPFGPPGSTSAQAGGQIFHAQSFVR